MGTVDPDPRFSLANERTYLAWVRTAVALIAGGVALDALDVDISDSLKTPLSVTLVATGGLMSFVALFRWRQVERAIAEGRPAPPFRSGPVVSVILLVVAAVIVVGLLAA